MSAPAFVVPHRLEAHEPPEARGLARDQVRLMVVSRREGRIVHARFSDLPSFLAAGDLLVINVSGTLPAAVAARMPDGTPVRLHFATAAPDRRPDHWWVVELRSADGAFPFRGAMQGERVTLAGDGRVELVAPYASGARLWLARLDLGMALPDYLARHGRPISYGYVAGDWGLEAYQTAYALAPGSAEMPSAGRPFTAELLTRLMAGGVQVAPVTLHTGVSSPERREAPYPEYFEVPPATARLVNAVHAWGGRVVAVGTTVVRALETVAGPDGQVEADRGWATLVVTPERALRAVDGLITGWHEPEASHLQLLEAAAGEQLLQRCYRVALERGYLWHEFGDSQLILG